ncbi:CBS and ACT domain-containing protein [soil metagenome]
MLVSEWMSPNPKTVSPKTPVMEAMQLLKSGGFRRMPVVDGDKLIGIVTDKDLKDATPSKATTLSVYELNYLLTKLAVRDVMTGSVITLAPADPVERAALLMEEHKISGLPVVEKRRLVGIITISDLLRAFVTVLGLREGGVRVTVDLPDEPGVLSRVTNVAAPSNIVAAVTSGVEQGRHRRLVLRVVCDGSSDFPGRLREAGVDVVDVHAD